MPQDDQHLKNLLRADTPPALPDTFVEHTVRRLRLPTQAPLAHGHHVLAWGGWVQKNKWWLAGAVLLAAWAVQQHPTPIDEDLLQIDTLSMSSFSVL